MRDRDALRRPLRLGPGDRIRHFLPDRLGRVRFLVDVEIRLHVLRMILYAMEALAVVFPDEFPVRLDFVLCDLGDSRSGESLRLGRSFKTLAQSVEHRRGCGH